MDTQTPVNKTRYLKLILFFSAIFAHLLWWDLILRQIPLVKNRAKSTAISRYRRIAHRFRLIAVEMGGVLIKLGQFLSVRVDILPAEVLVELADLQDEVPPEPLDRVLALLEAEFGRPVDAVFGRFDRATLAAASLAQTHKAILRDGREAVVKVQRPGIDVLVKTDLAAISVAIGWLKLYPRISRRVNLDWLAAEFSAVTSRELDFMAEGKNAERFAADFKSEPALHVPAIYWDYSTPRVLTMENVAYIPIGDLQAIEAAGINRAEVAKKLYGLYMAQIFSTYFVHADPHPGNIFIRPRPARPTEVHPPTGLPFQIIFIDFGMVVTIPERLRSALREYVIGLGTRDAHRMVQAYVSAGVLLPGADIKRLEEAHETVFERFWGLGMSQLRDVALNQAPQLIREYRDLIYEAPFQFQVDMLFAARAVGLLSGMATGLNPNFDPWAETIPFAEQMAKEELQKNWKEWAQELFTLSQLAVGLLPRVDKVLTMVQRGSLTYEASLAPDTRKMLNKIEQTMGKMTWALISVGTLLAGAVLRAAEGANPLNTAMMLAAIGLFLWRVVR